MVFAGASIALLIVPGPVVLYIVTRSVSQGRAAGLTSVAGAHVGSLVHVGAAVVGLSAVIVASATAFTAVKVAGAAYLLFLGVQTLRQRATRPVAEIESNRRLPCVFGDGLVVAVLNPKTAVFFLAFLPQFIDREAGPVWTQTLVLGLTFIAIGVVTDGCYALVASRAGSWLRSRPRLFRRQRIVTGSTYLALGALALAGSRPAD